MEDYLSFRKMITPAIIQIVFWLGSAVAVLAGLVTLSQNLLAGLLIILVVPVVLRVYAEILIIVFEINAALQDIRANIARSTPTG